MTFPSIWQRVHPREIVLLLSGTGPCTYNPWPPTSVSKLADPHLPPFQYRVVFVRCVQHACRAPEAADWNTQARGIRTLSAVSSDLSLVGKG